MKFALILITLYGGKAVTRDHVPGFATEQLCMEAVAVATSQVNRPEHILTPVVTTAHCVRTE